MEKLRYILRVFKVGFVVMMCMTHIGCRRTMRYKNSDSGLCVEIELYGEERATLKIGDKPGVYTDTVCFDNGLGKLQPIRLSIPTDGSKDIYILSPDSYISKIGSHNYNIEEVKDFIELDLGQYQWLDSAILADREQLYVSFLYFEVRTDV